LVNTPLKFRDKDYTQEAVRSVYGTAVSLTKDGDYNDIRYSIATLDALDCHPDIMDSVYRAHHRFGNLLHDTKFQINFRLEPGDIFSFNNRRLLHGELNLIQTQDIDICKVIIWIEMKLLED
jgi:gamma-butyrobetaine dioxygenase